MDGNRRWAKNHDKPALEGHRAGLDTLEVIVRHACERGVEHVVAYAFSTENWSRSQEEVAYLMNLIIEGTKERLTRLAEEGVRIRIIGERSRLPAEVCQSVEALEAKSAGGTKCTLWVALSYGGRTEIIAAAQSIAAAGEEITEESLRAHMWSREMPDPDLIIRTSGEQRLSNFLLWQVAYSELFFTETLWPDFSSGEFDRILDEYDKRERRCGK